MYDRFVHAAQIDASNWRDPQHDLEAIRLATSDELVAIERFLVARGIQHFMDAEALATIDTPSARQTLVEANQSDILSVLQKGRGTWGPLLLPPVIVAASVLLRISGRTWLALAAVGVPLVMLLMPVLSLLALIIVHYIMGKPIRWN